MLKTVTALHEADETAKNLNLGPVVHELRTVHSTCGPTAQSFKESALSARPESPFPFLNESRLNEDQWYRQENVWASSRALKKHRHENGFNIVDPDINFGCKLEMNVDKAECLFCAICVHRNCLENYNLEWEFIDSGASICKQCCTISRLAYTDSN